MLDITGIEEAELRQYLLFDELNHRVKNTLAIVQALALQTLRTQPDPQQFAEAFSDRLGSLARAPACSPMNSWRGAPLAGPRDDGTRGLHRRRPAGRDRRRCGDDPAHRHHHAQPHAARACDQRREVRRAVGRRGPAGDPVERPDTGSSIAVDLHWREDNGPPVSPPTKRGFGTRLLASSARQLGAEFEVDYAVQGLRCRLRFSVPRIE